MERSWQAPCGDSNFREDEMRQTDAMELVEVHEPFQALLPLLRSLGSSERQNLASDSFMADLLGEDPKMPPASDLEPGTLDLLYAILQIYSPMNRFRVYKTMFRYYPWRNRISKSDHFESACHLFVHECYIFEERLKILFDALARCAQRKGVDLDLKQISRRVMRFHKATFANALKLRGIHVHQEEFVPREIKRIRLLGLMLTGEKLSKHKLPFNVGWLESRAISKARKQWMENCDEAERATRRILLSAFRPTKLIWSRIAEEKIK
jgi:hypothetical protein